MATKTKAALDVKIRAAFKNTSEFYSSVIAPRVKARIVELALLGKIPFFLAGWPLRALRLRRL